MLRILRNNEIETINFIERIINVWNFLPHTVDFSSFSKFKRSFNRVDFSVFLRYA